MTDQPKTSGATAFRDRLKRQQDGELLELSSGMTIKVRRPNESKLIANGEVPALLVNSALNIQQQKAGPQDLRNYAALQRLYARLACIDPVVIEGEPVNDNEVSVDAFNPEELTEIYLYVTSGLDDLRRFREERQRLSAGPDLQAVSGDAA